MTSCATARHLYKVKQADQTHNSKRCPSLKIMVYYYNHTANVMTSNIPPNVTTRSQDQAQQQGQQSQRSQGQQQSGFQNPYRQVCDLCRIEVRPNKAEY
ncbi:hypothetical protein P168DRAFT_287282 [Aspergillus campestris IBT 28561]|uniref:Uncharacterized protein n=1 Tax=Aspergillus campestris (strain IBT 28561) TaxID=1392248 RepID=A0A2I1DH68_ASPC2|nr:uncharacterized protein P168DRAFT_287282 [Aspergillus campestris IBT 28561]PKY09215.1 hypothetical protein P168DRAFT_287282 [Aspergillus campestris IBT 28561]